MCCRGESFRPEYAKVGRVRCLFPKYALLLATATATATIKQGILDLLSLDKDEVQHISVLPDRWELKINTLHELILVSGTNNSLAVLKGIYMYIQCTNPIKYVIIELNHLQ